MYFFTSNPIIVSKKMKLVISRVRYFAFVLVFVLALCKFSDCYDPLDPNGNITVTFDILHWTLDGYVARVTIQNYYQYRHVDEPGWKIGWSWTKNEVIWSMTGAIATHQGNCSSFKSQIPHCCSPQPVIIDLMSDAMPQNRSDSCCRNGVLTAWAIYPHKSFSSFGIVVGNLEGNSTVFQPQNLTLMAPGPGYTCAPFEDTDPTVSSVVGGRRQEQVFRTWKSTCTYSTYLANKTPVCCVSLSTFYNPTITSCPLCSCGCRVADQSTKSCIREGSSSSNLLADPDIVRCTDHMCPLRVHWHVMSNYKDHWRVKLTVSNYNYARNYSNWNVLVQHPGFSQPATAYSFNNIVLNTVGDPDKVAVFWGIDYYNNELVQANDTQLGSVTTDILLPKDLNTFTLRNGWAFPRRVYFNGENCQMPLPDTFPMLPNSSSRQKPIQLQLLVILVYSTYRMIFCWL